MAATAINSVRAEMLLHSVGFDALAERLAAAGHPVAAPELKSMVRKRRMPALTYLNIMSVLGGRMTRLPDDLSELH